MPRYAGGRESGMYEELLDEVRDKARDYADGITHDEWQSYLDEEQSEEFFEECEGIIERSQELALDGVWLDEAETVFIGEVNEALGIPYRGYEHRDGGVDLDWDEDDDV